MAPFPSLGFPSLDSSCSFKEIWKGARCATVSLRPRAAAGRPRCPCLNDPHPAAWLTASPCSHLALSAPECNLEKDFGDPFRAWEALSSTHSLTLFSPRCSQVPWVTLCVIPGILLNHPRNVRPWGPSQNMAEISMYVFCHSPVEFSRL